MLNVTETKKSIKSKIGKKNIISTISVPYSGAENPEEDNLPDEPSEEDDNQISGTLTPQIPVKVKAQVAKATASATATPVTVAPFATGGRKTNADGLQLAYIVNGTTLFSLRADEFSALDLDNVLDSLKGRRELLHNPTNVFKTQDGLRSSEDRRPLFYVEEGVLVRKDTIEVPVKVKSVKGEKVAKAAKSTGPSIFYIDDMRNEKQLNGHQLYSLNAAQFETVKADPSKLSEMKVLKHNPTCVSKNKDGFFESDEPGARPMYFFQVADAEAGFDVDTIVPVNVAPYVSTIVALDAEPSTEVDIVEGSDNINE